jgi:uncharacterized protein YutE (UPF0331/DUF86 family)
MHASEGGFMTDDVAINKAAAIERALARIREEYAGDPSRLFNDPTRQDAIVLNLQRACQSAIDLAMHLVRRQRIGMPQDSRDAFRLLAQAGFLDQDLADRLMQMVGFRNVAAHDYDTLSLPVVQHLIEHRLDDLNDLAAMALRVS